MKTPSVGDAVLVRVSDPWEFDEAVAKHPFPARTVAVSIDDATGTAELLLEVSPPLMFEGEPCEFFVAKPRHMEEPASTRGRPAPGYALTRIPAARARGSAPFDLSWWRGGPAALATIHLVA